MLTLTRKIHEKIHIGEEIEIEVRRVAGNRVTLAIKAPRAARILRGELFEAARQIEIEEAVLQEITDNGSTIGTAGS